jgi:serine/threonine protein kinase
VFSTGIILHEMLTTEKLFRGDTEFALMEKVRKAEVAPPSKFNRRVPEALDRIVLKALARDLPDRYQSAKDLSDDLSSFMAQYRFQPSEMQEFMRNLFRVDYQKEADEVSQCQSASIDSEPEISLESAEIEIATEQRKLPVPEPRREAPPADATPQPPAKSGGLWSRLKDKFSK